MTGDFTNAVSELDKFAPVPGSWSGDPKGFHDLAVSAFTQPEQNTWAALVFRLRATGTGRLMIRRESAFRPGD